MSMASQNGNPKIISGALWNRQNTQLLVLNHTVITCYMNTLNGDSLVLNFEYTVGQLKCFCAIFLKMETDI